MAGVDSIGHGHGADRAALQLMKTKGTYLVLTLSVVDAAMARRFGGATNSPKAVAFLDGLKHAMSIGEIGVKIADGSDASDASDAVSHRRSAVELEAMTQRGLAPMEAIRAATISTADLIGWSDKVGALEHGMYADLIAVEGVPIADIKSLQNALFVMKGGKVIRDDVLGTGPEKIH